MRHAAELVGRAVGAWLAAAADARAAGRRDVRLDRARPSGCVLSRRAVLASVRGHARAARRPRAVAAGAARRRTSPGCRWSAARWSPGHRPVLLDDHASLAAAVAARPATAVRLPGRRPSCTGCSTTPDDVGGAAPPAHGAARRRPGRPGAARPRATTPGVRVVATYGTAETAGGCVYDGLPARRRRGRDRRRRPDPDRRADAVRRVRRRPGADGARCWSTAGS